MKIEVRSYPAGDIVSDLATKLQTQAKSINEEHSLEIPQELGSGTVNGISFPSGLGIVSFNCCFKEDVQIKYNQTKLHPAKFIYCNSGEVFHRLNTENEMYRIGRFQAAIVASKRDQGHILEFKAHTPIELCTLHINRSEMIPRIVNELDSLKPELSNMLRDSAAMEDFHHRAFYSLDMHDICEDMMKRNDQGLIKKLYLEGKAFDILTYLLEKYQHDADESNHHSPLPEGELESIQSAIVFIKNNLEKEISVKQLSQQTGLNANKLQVGFKALTGFTVNDYIKNTRLRMARELITSTSLTISEIVYKIGLINRGYFSKIFKSRYGLSPTEFRKRIQGRKSA